MFRKILLVPVFFLFLFSCKTNQTSSGSVTVTGEFRSVQGVMDPLSCYASNGGYITQANGERVAVSFKGEEAITCKSISVTGTYTTKTVKAEPNNPCAAGEMKILEVETYSCK